MNRLFSLTFLLFATNCFAQITISSDDMPNIDDTYTVSNGFLLDIDLNETGENYLWDFTDLESILYDTINMVAVSETPFFYQFLFNNFFEEEYVADFAQEGQSFGLGEGFEMEDVYFYYQNNDEDFRSLGMGATINDIPLPMRSEPIDIVYQFPLNYNDSDTSYSVLSLDIPDMLSFVMSQTRVNNVDGWGTVSLPIGDFECIRVRSELAITDSIYIQGQGGQFDQPETIEYKWLALGEGIPVLQINTIAGIPTQIIYKDFQEGEPDNTISLETLNIQIYPIPSSDFITINGLLIDENSSLKVIDSKGSTQIMENLNGQSEYQLDISFLSKGTYILELYVGGKVLKKKILKQ